MSESDGRTEEGVSGREELSLADWLEFIAQNDYMIDDHYLPSGRKIMEAATQLRERDERIAELDREGLSQAEQIVRLCDALVYVEGILRRAGREVDPDEDLAGQIAAYVGELESRAEAAERKLAEADEAIRKAPKLVGMDWKMKPEWFDLPAVRRALGEGKSERRTEAAWYHGRP